MTKTITDCDCCQKKNIENPVRVKMPIIAHTDDGQYMTASEMDFCVDCANRFLKLYYDIAREHGSSGLHAIYED